MSKKTMLRVQMACFFVLAGSAGVHMALGNLLMAGAALVLSIGALVLYTKTNRLP